MQQTQPERAWQISQVQQLIGLPRRDIQRACYNGQGGASILSPADSSWGRRTYNVDDLAKLYVVKRFRERGFTLAETRQAVSDFASNGDWIAALDIEIDHLREQCEKTAETLIQGESLRQAINSHSDTEAALAQLVEKSLAASDLVSEDKQTQQTDATPQGSAIASALMTLTSTSNTAPSIPLDQLAEVLDAPGMELAIEVLLGTGSYERICERIAEATDMDK